MICCFRHRLNKKVNFQENYSQIPFDMIKNGFVQLFLDLLPDAPGPVCVCLSSLKVRRLARLKQSAQGREVCFLLKQVLPQCLWAKAFPLCNCTSGACQLCKNSVAERQFELFWKGSLWRHKCCGCCSDGTSLKNHFMMLYGLMCMVGLTF